MDGVKLFWGWLTIQKTCLEACSIKKKGHISFLCTMRFISVFEESHRDLLFTQQSLEPLLDKVLPWWSRLNEHSQPQEASPSEGHKNVSRTFDQLWPLLKLIRKQVEVTSSFSAVGFYIVDSHLSFPFFAWKEMFQFHLAVHVCSFFWEFFLGSSYVSSLRLLSTAASFEFVTQWRHSKSRKNLNKPHWYCRQNLNKAQKYMIILYNLTDDIGRYEEVNESNMD